jgi:anaphase-promoting complex subunit 5
MLPFNNFDDSRNEQDAYLELAQDSVFGLFVRRATLEFNKMTYAQQCRMLGRLADFYQQPATAAGLDSVSGARSDGSSRENSGLLRQARSTRGLRLGEYRAKTNGLLAPHSRAPLGHYIRHLYGMHASDFTTSLNEFHRFFDLQAPLAIKQRRKKADKAGGGGSRVVDFQYSALSLAALHYRFGHIDEALRAIHMSVRFAQQKADPICLQHALGWLTRLSSGHAASQLVALFGSSTKVLAEAEDVEKGSEAVYLHGLARLTMARQALWEGKPPATVLDHVSSSLSTGFKEASSELVAMGYLLQAGLFDLYGHSGLAMLYPQMVLRNGSSDSDAETCNAYCKVALYYFSQGQFRVAKKVLEAAEGEFPRFTPQSKLWLATSHQIYYQMALYREDWGEALTASLELHGMLSALSSSGVDIEYRRILMLQARGWHKDAVAAIQAVLRAASRHRGSARVSHGPLEHIKLIQFEILHAELHHSSGNHHVAQLAVLKCITLAEKYRVSVLRANALVLLADIQLSLRMEKQALAAVTEALPTVLAHGSVEAKGVARMTYAKCTFATASKAGDRASQVQAVGSLQSARSMFRLIGAKKLERKSVYWLARLHDALGDSARRNQCAREFRFLQQSLCAAITV